MPPKLEKAARKQEIKVCPYEFRCSVSDECYLCQWGGASKQIRGAANESFVLGAEWQSKQSPWISVADEEPPEYKDVLLSAGSRPDIFVGYFNGKDFRCRSTGDEIEYFRVLHWCSIPE